MIPVVCALLSVTCSGGPAGPPESKSFLYQPAFCIDDVLRGPAEPYVPRPGDIMLRMDHSIFWRVTHYMALACDPNGSGIIFARPDGTMAVLEAGPNDCMWVRTLDVCPHLGGYCAQGRVWIRRRKVPLTPEQSAALTHFALANDGKLFALQRLGLQLTPFRTRGPVRTYFMGKVQGPDRWSYFCSELVSEACVALRAVCAQEAMRVTGIQRWGNMAGKRVENPPSMA